MTSHVRMSWQLGLVCLLVLACPGAARAADGDLDRSFGHGGRQVTDLGALDQATAIALAPGGKIVVAGTRMVPAKPSRDFALARYNRDGSLDRSFSGDGIQTTDIAENDLAYGVAIQRDGKIVLVGESWEVGTALARYNTNGSLDPSFGTGGIQTAGFGPAREVAIQPDGKIVTAGGSSDFAVMRFNADGSPDAAFGAGGLLSSGVAATGRDATSVALAPGGRIVAAGAATTTAGRGGLDIAIARYKGADGSSDASFSADGKLTAGHAGVDDYASDLTVQPDGKLIAAGQVGLDGFGLFRFNPDGSPDTTFGGDGLRTANVSAGNDGARGVALAPGGRIVVAGDGDGFTLARLRSSGSLDTSFSKDGRQTTTMSGGYDVATGVAVQPDCRIVVAGEADGDFALARYRSACPPGGARGGDPRARLFGSRSQKLGRVVSVSASCREDPCRVTARGSVRVVQTAPGAATAFALKAVRRTIARKGARARIALRLGKAARAAIRRALRRGPRVTVKLHVSFRQPGAKTTTLRRNVRLKL